MTSERVKKYTPAYEMATEELHRALLDQRDAHQLLISADRRVDVARNRVNHLEKAGKAYAPTRQADA